MNHNNNKCTLEGQGNGRGGIEEGAGSALLAMQQHSTDSNNENNAASSKQKISDCTTTLLISMEFCSHHPNANRKLHCKTTSSPYSFLHFSFTFPNRRTPPDPRRTLLTRLIRFEILFNAFVIKCKMVEKCKQRPQEREMQKKNEGEKRVVVHNISISIIIISRQRQHR